MISIGRIVSFNHKGKECSGKIQGSHYGYYKIEIAKFIMVLIPMDSVTKVIN